MSRAARTPRGFADHRGGGVAILFALLSLPLLMMTGAAVDYGLATRLETKLQAATDATALLLCQTPLSTSETALNTMARATMTGQMGAEGLVVDPLVIANTPRRITLNTHKVSSRFFDRFLAGTLVPGVTAQCATPLPTTFEIALVLDTTGSMRNAGDDGVTKLDALKSAAKNFVSYVFTNAAFGSGTKVSIVPFAAAVAVSPSLYRTASWVDTQGKSRYHWTNLSANASGLFASRLSIFDKLKAAKGNWGWAGCFEGLPYPQNVTDMATTADSDSLYIPYFAPDEGGDSTVGFAKYGSNYSLNSYIDDDTDAGNCPALASGTSYATAQARACKYVAPKGAESGTVVVDLGPNGPNFGCVSQPLQRMTNNTATLNALIESLTAGGTTNIHEGVMWGWRTISPRSVFADGAPYGTTATNKVIVLMTDGMNTWLDNPYPSYNESFFSANGYFVNANGTNPNPHFSGANQGISNGTAARAGLDALTRQGCANAKAAPANISIYTIGLSVKGDPIDSAGKALLQNCATSTSQAFLANDSNSLIKAFDDIAKSIGALRLTQ